METVGYLGLGRQSGLMNEMRAVANNIANMSTNGYRAERLLYSEFVSDRGADAASASLGHGNVRASDFSQGALRQTGNPLDVALEGEGFFRVRAGDADMLTRQSSFTLSPEGQVVDASGAVLLDDGGAPIAVPQGAGPLAVGADGTISAGGAVLARIGVWSVPDPAALTRRDGVRFDAPQDTAAVEDARMMQGFVETSNVDPVRQITRMIEVQRAYELTQSLMDRDDERIRGTIREIGK